MDDLKAIALAQGLVPIDTPTGFLWIAADGSFEIKLDGEDLYVCGVEVADIDHKDILALRAEALKTPQTRVDEAMELALKNEALWKEARSLYGQTSEELRVLDAAHRAICENLDVANKIITERDARIKELEANYETQLENAALYHSRLKQAEERAANASAAVAEYTLSLRKAEERAEKAEAAIPDFSASLLAQRDVTIKSLTADLWAARKNEEALYRVIDTERAAQHAFYATLAKVRELVDEAIEADAMDVSGKHLAHKLFAILKDASPTTEAVGHSCPTCAKVRELAGELDADRRGEKFHGPTDASQAILAILEDSCPTAKLDGDKEGA